ncbi:MAG TPA: helix-turn-helix transcriptional regulator [Kofleriaceae bacterium]|jgi:transcriptional regulator with XRE-family HTH domain
MSRLTKPDPVAKSIGLRVRELRVERGLTIERLAYENDISKGTVADLERGLARPSVVTLKRLADGLGVELLDLFTRPGDRARHDLIDATRTLPTHVIKRMLAEASDAPKRR